MNFKSLLVFVAALVSAPTINVDSWEGQNSYEIMKISQSNDTLSLVSGSDFAFYPFGKTLSVSEFTGQMIKGGLKEIDSTFIHNEKVYKAASNDGELKYLKIDRVGKLNVEIVSAWYTTSKLKMQNGIRIGDSKEKVFRIYLIRPKLQESEKIKVLGLSSALDGIWHFYTFNKNRLEKIEIRSDYKFE